MEFDNSVGAEHAVRISQHPAHFHNSAGGGSPPTYVQSQFRHNVVAQDANGMEIDRMATSRRQMRPSSSPHFMPNSGAGIDAHLMPQSYFNEVSMGAPKTPPLATTPQYSAAMLSPHRPKILSPSLRPTDRSLPPCNVSESNIEDAFAGFILYCNPSFALSTDTSMLKERFRKPPENDGKAFNTWTLFELIGKLDRKEIKTWTELVQELGVEKPKEGQSSQKVQQYSVRLKRWMRALHVDAFFGYLLGKPHEYFTKVPSATEPPPESRDGVPFEEDTALRALDPRLRPKKGRRKIGEQDDDVERASAPPQKRVHLDNSLDFQNSTAFDQANFPTSAIPFSAHPDDGYINSANPWGPGSAMVPPHLLPHQPPQSASVAHAYKWRVNTQDAVTPHPLSAMDTPATQLDFGEPRSALTPSTKRRTKRSHHPNVSSAWPGASGSSGKFRGRPPNRAVQNGQFGSFPANPRKKDRSPVEQAQNPIIASSRSPESADTVAADAVPRPEQEQAPQSALTEGSANATPTTRSGRPRERLQLKVPERTGAPVHLVETSAVSNGGSGSGSNSVTVPGLGHSRDMSFGISSRATALDVDSRDPRIDDYRQLLLRSLAADLLRAVVSGLSSGRKRLKSTEAKALADAILSKMGIPRTRHDSVNTGSDQRRAVVRAASWLGLNDRFEQSTGRLDDVGTMFQNSGAATKRIEVRRFRVGDDGFESPIDDDEEYAMMPAREVREIWDVSWRATMGSADGEFSLRDLVLSQADEVPEAALNNGDGQTHEAEDKSWKERYLELKKSMVKVEQLRETILDAIL